MTLGFVLLVLLDWYDSIVQKRLRQYELWIIELNISIPRISSTPPSSVNTKFSGPFCNVLTKSFTSFIVGPVMMRSSAYCYV